MAMYSVNSTEAIENCSKVMNIQLPKIKEEITGLLSNIWALDYSNYTYTLQDKNRTLFYLQEKIYRMDIISVKEANDVITEYMEF